MPFNDNIQVDSSLQPAPAAPPDTARRWAMVAPTSPNGYTTKSYSAIGELDDDGWTTAFAAYNAAARVFSATPQETAITGLIVIARATAVAEVWQIDINSTTDGDHKIFVGGVLAATFAASGNTAEQIKDGLISAYNLGPFAAAQTAATVDVDSLSLTAAVAGIPFLPTVEVPGGTIHDVVQTVESVGVYQDLELAHTGEKFRNLLMPGALDVELDEGRRWVQADTSNRRCFLWAENADPGVYDSLDTDNLAVQWLTAGHPRVNLLSHPNATEYMASAAAGVFGGGYPGKRMIHYFPLSGSLETAITSARTSAQTATMRARRMSFTERMEGPQSTLLLVARDPNVPSGVFAYQRWAEDHLWYVARAHVHREMQSREGTNLNDAGLSTLRDSLATQLVPLLNEGVIDADFVVSYVPLDQVPAGELAIGDYKTTGALIIEATVTPKLRALRVKIALTVV